jgi:hypothetical protein
MDSSDLRKLRSANEELSRDFSAFAENASGFAETWGA